MTDTPRCATCAHWRDRQEEFGFCDALTNPGGPGPIQAYAGTSEDLLDCIDWIYTRRDFGCPSHTPALEAPHD